MLKKRQQQSGFTLIEVMVVTTIIAILVGAVALKINFKDPAKDIKDTALRTGIVMQMASDQAVYSRQQLGIRFHPESYEFYQLQADDKGVQKWVMIEDEQLKYKQIASRIDISVDISGLPIVLEPLEDEMSQVTDETPIKPHVMFLSNGEIMPDFKVVFADPDREFEHQVMSGEEEAIVVEQLD